MASRALPNYLRAFRKRTGLSQPDIAYLLGIQDGGYLSRLENFHRTPKLRVSCALVILFRAPLRDLFQGDYQTVEREIFNRAKRLGDRIAKEPQTPINARKLAALMAIIKALTAHDEP